MMSTTAPSTLRADGDVSLRTRGYVESFAGARSVAESSRVNPGNVLGIDGDFVDLRVDLVAEWKADRWRLVLEEFAASDLDGDDAFARLFQGHFSWYSADKRLILRAGKSVPGWGVGNLWNPVRTFENRRDLLCPAPAIEGIYQLEAQWFGCGGSTTVLALPPIDDDADGWGWAARYSSSLADVDYSLSVYTSEDDGWRPGLELSKVWGAATVVVEALYQTDDRSERIGPDGVRSRRDGDALSYVLGVNWVLPRDLFLIVEYFHDDERLDGDELRDFYDVLPREGDLYNPFGNGQDNLYLGLTRSFVWRDSSLGASVFYNDPSEIALVQLRAEAQIAGDLRATLSLQAFDEPSGASVNVFRDAALLRLRWNF